MENYEEQAYEMSNPANKGIRNNQTHENYPNLVVMKKAAHMEIWCQVAWMAVDL